MAHLDRRKIEIVTDSLPPIVITINVGYWRWKVMFSDIVMACWPPVYDQLGLLKSEMITSYIEELN